MLRPDRTPEKYEETIETVLPKLKLLGFEEFKVDHPDFEAPSGFTLKGTEELHFAPDIAAHRKGRKAYFEISKKTDNLQRLISKWKLLATKANMKDNFFGIITPRGTIKFTKDIVENYQIEANLIRV